MCRVGSVDCPHPAEARVANWTVKSRRRDLARPTAPRVRPPKAPPPPLVTKFASANIRVCTLGPRRETEREQHTHTIGLDQEPGSQSMPTLLALDELRCEAVPMKSCGRGEAGYSSADDQDRLDLCHGSLQSR